MYGANGLHATAGDVHNSRHTIGGEAGGRQGEATEARRKRGRFVRFFFAGCRQWWGSGRGYVRAMIGWGGSVEKGSGGWFLCRLYNSA